MVSLAGATDSDPNPLPPLHPAIPSPSIADVLCSQRQDILGHLDKKQAGGYARFCRNGLEEPLARAPPFLQTSCAASTSASSYPLMSAVAMPTPPDGCVGCPVSAGFVGIVKGLRLGREEPNDHSKAHEHHPTYQNDGQ